MSKTTTNSDPQIVIGIDLGTTYSCVGICRNKKVEIISDENSSRTMPSYVAFTESGERLVGKAAKDQLIRNPQRTIYNVKRLMGLSWDDELTQKEKKYFSVEIIEKNSRPQIEIQTKKIQSASGDKKRCFTAEEISGMILKRLKNMAEGYINEKIHHAVITVPAYFSDAQRQATINAGTLAQLNVLKILNEPTAAAIAYGRNSTNDTKIIFIFDLGGGTFDVSIMKIANKKFSVLATSGNTHLGGEDFNQNVINYFIDLYKKRKHKDISQNDRALQRLRSEVENAKRTLTHASSSEITIYSLIDGEDFDEILTKAKFEELNKELFNDTLKPMQQALDDAGLAKNQVDEIVMVGGSSRIPKIRELVKNFFNGKEPLQRIDPDEAVVHGAAIQAGIISGQEDSIVLFDVNPLSLGIEDSKNQMLIIIPRNSTLPVKKTIITTTSEDYQTTVEFPVYEGELPLAKDNLFLGTFTLNNIEYAPKGIPVLETTFEIDVNGILHVSAQDNKTKQKVATTIKFDKKRPTEAEINEMIKISENYDRIEENRNESIKYRKEFLELVHSFRENLDINSLTNVQKERLKNIIEDTTQWLKENKICSVEEYKRRKEKFKTDVFSCR